MRCAPRFRIRRNLQRTCECRSLTLGTAHLSHARVLIQRTIRVFQEHRRTSVEPVGAQSSCKVDGIGIAQNRIGEHWRIVTEVIGCKSVRRRSGRCQVGSRFHIKSVIYWPDALALNMQPTTTTGMPLLIANIRPKQWIGVSIF